MYYEKLITFGIIALVFVLRMKAQNKKRKQMEEEQARKLERQKTQKMQPIKEGEVLSRQLSRLPPPPQQLKKKPIQKISERGVDFHRDIENRTLKSTITSQKLVTQFGEEKTQLISEGFKAKISIDDTAYDITSSFSITRISSLVRSLKTKRNLVVINEILTPPYID